LSRPSRDQTLRRSARRTPSGGCSSVRAARRERLVEDPVGARLGEHLEQGIDARLDRPFAQQIGAEAVNRADVRFLQALNGVGEVAPDVGRATPLAQALELFLMRSFSSPAAFSVKVTATICSIARAAAGQHVQNPRDQLGGLAGAGGGLDDHRVRRGRRG
jgi:hypothetical protein